MQNKNTRIHEQDYYIRAIAHSFASFGLSIIPTNSRKEPTITAWKQFQVKQPEADQINDMFPKQTHGFGIVCGKVSGNLEILDEDLKYDLTGTMHEEFKSALDEQAVGLFAKLLIQQTVNGGYHYVYRCPEIEGSLKLASRPANDEEINVNPNDKQRVLYETKGEGGYCIGAGTPGYSIVQGSFDNIPTLTTDERDVLLAVARSFEQCPKEFVPHHYGLETTRNGLSAFEDYDTRGDLLSLLEVHGWTTVYKKGSKTFLKRPGETSARYSGNFNSDKNWFSVFSTSTVFEIQKAYRPYAVYAILECNGDFSKASKQLYDAGYGERRKSGANSTISINGQPSSDDNADYSNLIINAVDLLKMENMENRYLLSPIIPRIGTGVLAGMPDSGKSQFARQLCIAIATGMNHFLDYGISPIYHRALYIATEDDQNNTSFLLRRQLDGLGQSPTENLSFIFADTLNQDEVLHTLGLHLTNTPCDLVVIDSYGDVFIGNDSNNNIAMRQTVKNFDRYAKKYGCFVLFVHHITKSSYKQAPHQMHIMGGAGLVQKTRLALQLSQDDSGGKFLTVVKGNYCPQELKQNAMELLFDKDHFVFSRTGKVVPRELLNSDCNKDKDTKFDRLENRADEIFGHQSFTNTQFCKKYCDVTGKGIAQAKRDLKSMEELEIVVKDGRYYSLKTEKGSIDNSPLSGPDDYTPF